VRRHRGALLALAPLALYLAVLTVVPAVDTLRLSLTGPDGAFPTLARYRALWDAPPFRAALANTVVVTLLSLAFQVTLGLAIALLLSRPFPLRAAVRTVVLLPLGIPTVVVGAVMLLVFSRAGYLNAVLGALADAAGALTGAPAGFSPPGWLVVGGWPTLAVLALADTWKVLPLVVLLLLAGLESIPDEVHEAAAVDAASRWQRLRHVVLPLLAPYLTTAVVLRAIDGFRIFELALVLTGRVEPVLGTYLWSRYAPPVRDVEGAAAVAVVLALLILTFVAAYLRLVARRGEVEA
jgi:trehalose transport system permease protein